MRLLPTYSDPFRLSKHLIERHGIAELTVDSLDSDALRRMHRVLHEQRCDHVHAVWSQPVAR